LNVLGSYGSQRGIELILTLFPLQHFFCPAPDVPCVCFYLKFPWGATLPGPSFLISCFHAELCLTHYCCPNIVLVTEKLSQLLSSLYEKYLLGC
jgi:hypothetical protein